MWRGVKVDEWVIGSVLPGLSPYEKGLEDTVMSAGMGKETKRTWLVICLTDQKGNVRWRGEFDRSWNLDLDMISYLPSL